MCFFDFIVLPSENTSTLGSWTSQSIRKVSHQCLAIDDWCPLESVMIRRAARNVRANDEWYIGRVSKVK